MPGDAGNLIFELSENFEGKRFVKVFVSGVLITFSALSESMRKGGYYPFRKMQELIIDRCIREDFRITCGNDFINGTWIDELKTMLFWNRLFKIYLLWSNLSMLFLLIFLCCCCRCLTNRNTNKKTVKKVERSENTKRKLPNGYS